MKISQFLIISLLILTPFESLNGRKYGKALADYATSSNRKKFENEMIESYISASSRKNPSNVVLSQKQIPKTRSVQNQPEPVDESKKVKVKEEELSKKEMETVKDAAAKWQSTRAVRTVRLSPEGCTVCQQQKTPRQETRNNVLLRKGVTLSAECEQCELQIKVNGEGILLRCKDCREVAPDEVIFPTGNAKRIIKIP